MSHVFMIDYSSKNKIPHQKHLLFHKPFIFYYVISLFKASPLRWLDVSCVTVHTDTRWFLLDLHLKWVLATTHHLLLVFINFFIPDCVTVWHWNSAVMKIRTCWIGSLLVLLGCLASVLRLLGKLGISFSRPVDFSAGHSLVTFSCNWIYLVSADFMRYHIILYYIICVTVQGNFS